MIAACLCPHCTRCSWVWTDPSYSSFRSGNITMSWMSGTQADMQGLLNVTADSLAEYCGLTGDHQANSVFLESQVRILLVTPSFSPFLICTSAWFAPKKSIPKRDQFVRLAAKVVPFPWLNLKSCFCQWILRQVSPRPRRRLRCARYGIQYTHENAQCGCLPVSPLRLSVSPYSHSFQALLR